MKDCSLQKSTMERMRRLWSFRRGTREICAAACIVALNVQAKGSFARAHIPELQIRLFYTEDRQSPLGGNRWSPCLPAWEMQILSVHKSLPFKVGVCGIQVFENHYQIGNPSDFIKARGEKKELRTPLTVALREHGRALTEHRLSRGATRAHCMKQPVHAPSQMQLQRKEATIAVPDAYDDLVEITAVM